MDLNEIVCSKLKELRKQKGITQEEAAELLCMERTTYNKLEQGKRDISLNSLVQIAEVFKVEIPYLLNFKEPYIDNSSSNSGVLSVQGINTTLNITLPEQVIDEIKKKFNI